MIEFVKKRNGDVEPYSHNKVIDGIFKAMSRVGEYDEKLANSVADRVAYSQDAPLALVEDIQQEIENQLMNTGLHDVAREYIQYRFTHQPSIFRKRENLKPYEYPELLEYVDAIRHSYWVHTEFNYQSDVQDFKVKLTENEQGIVTRAMLAISQIEVAVKTFWAKIGDRLPKPEIAAVGVTFGESEVRHADAYSNLIEVLGLNEEFKKVTEVPAIKKRIAYLEKSLASPLDDKEYFKNILLFSVFIENISLFSQFLVMMSFNKYGNVLKGISNAVQATSKEEDIHAKFGIELVNLIKKEKPDYFDEDVEKEIITMAHEALEAEYEIIDWIFKDGDCQYCNKEQCYVFIEKRMTNSMEQIGISYNFVDTRLKHLLPDLEWFEDEVLISSNVDFFYKKSTSYNKKSKAITEDDLF